MRGCVGVDVEFCGEGDAGFDFGRGCFGVLEALGLEELVSNRTLCRELGFSDAYLEMDGEHGG